jgi:hypothetical protein
MEIRLCGRDVAVSSTVAAASALRAAMSESRISPDGSPSDGLWSFARPLARNPHSGKLTQTRGYARGWQGLQPAVGFAPCDTASSLLSSSNSAADAQRKHCCCARPKQHWRTAPFLPHLRGPSDRVLQVRGRLSACRSGGPSHAGSRSLISASSRRCARRQWRGSGPSRGADR